MFIFTGEKSYLSTDYCPSRKYMLARFVDGNGNKWWQLAYRWGFWTYYLNQLGHHDSGSCVRGPMTFDTADEARQHLEREAEWLDQMAKSQEISVDFEDL